MKKLILITMLSMYSVVITAQTGLKYLKINKQIVNSNLDTIKAGVVIIPNQIFIGISPLKNDSILVSITVDAYKDINAKSNGKKPYSKDELFSQNVSFLIPKTEYTNGGFEGNLITRMQNYYLKLYPNNVVIKTIQ
jgi:hypothetical protein